jgi:RHS repeat-associated protein
MGRIERWHRLIRDRRVVLWVGAVVLLSGGALLGSGSQAWAGAVGLASQPPPPTTTSPAPGSEGSTPAGPNDPTVTSEIPICGDQDGSEQPLVFNCSSYTRVPDQQLLTVGGSGQQTLTFDYVYKSALNQNEIVLFKVDDDQAAIGSLHPGDAGYLSAAYQRAQVVFPGGSDASAPDRTFQFNGGDRLMLMLVETTLAALEANNPSNSPSGSPRAFFSYDALNPDAVDHMVGYVHTDGSREFAFEDFYGGGDGDYNDAVFDVRSSSVPNPPPPEQNYTCNDPGIYGSKLAKCASTTSAEPVNTLTGAFEDQVTDVSLPGTGIPFTFTRSYTSADPTVVRMGQGWTDSLSASLAIQGNGDVLVRAEDGQQVYYTKQPDGSFVGAAGAQATLTSVGSNYQLVRNDQVTYSFDSQGRLTALKDRDNQGLTLTYDGSGNLSTVTDAAGRQVTFSFTGSLLTQLTAPGGRTVSFGYTGSLLTSVTDLRGKTTTYTYDANNRLASIIDPLGHAQVQNTYGADGRVTEQKDALNNTTTFAWDSLTQTATITDPRGNISKDVYQNGVLFKRIDGQSNVTQFGFDSSVNETSVTSPDGKQVTLGYDSKGNLTSAASVALNANKTYSYNARNDIATVTDARGKVTSNGYDTNGNLTSVTVDGQSVAQYAYNAQGQVTSYTDGNNKATAYTYDASGNVASVTDALGNKTTYTYDAAGNMTTRVDPLGNVQGGNPAAHTWTYTYDNAGHLLTQTNPLGKTTTSTYDDAGNLVSVTDANNHATTYTYDQANRLTSITEPAAGTTHYTYDAAGNRLTVTDALNHTTTSTYDANNRLESVTTPLNEKTTYFYDANGNLSKQVEPRGNVQGANRDDYATTFTYDAAGHLLTETDPLAHTTTYTYDKVGNETSVADPNNHTTSYAYDAQNRLTSITAPDNGVTQYTYDGAGNVLTRVDAKSHTTTYTYDAANELLSKTSPTGQKWTYAFDADGNRTSMVDANGNSTQTAGDGTTTYSYDAANRLTAVGYSDSTPGASLTYDSVGNRTQMTDGAGSQTYTYDAANRPTGVTRGTNTFSYAYDLAGDVTTRTYPDGTATTYGYDNDGRLASATSGGVTTAYAYDAASNLVTTTLPSGNGYVETRTYDRAGRLTDVKNAKAGSTLSEFAMTMDAVGNPTTIVRSGAVSSTTTYGYDTYDRLTSVCFQAGTCPGGGDPFIRWTYDAVGNRLTEARSNGTTNYTYNNADQLTQAGSTAYTYDQNGNEKSAGSRTFNYDLADRLASTTSGGTTTTYTYDGDGNRLQASTGSQASKKTNYLWDVQGDLAQLALERDGSNALLRRYVYGVQRVSMTTGAAAYYYHYDNLGSVANVTSSSGASQWTEVYEPFGSIRAETKNAGGAPTNFMKFAGEYQDPTGLYYLRARQYDPTIGRFTRLDPAVPAPANLYVSSYVYADDQPTTMVDPSGMGPAPARTLASAVTSPADVEAKKPPWANANCQSVAKIRERLVTYAHWAVVNEKPKAYSHLGRPIRDYPQIDHWPYSTDCSGGVSLLYMWATCGNPKYDPNGTDWGGASSTIEMQHGVAINVKNLQPGDLVVYGSEHVAMAVTPYRGMEKTQLVSFGSAPGHYVSLAASNAYHSSVKPSYRRYLPNQ